MEPDMFNTPFSPDCNLQEHDQLYELIELNMINSSHGFDFDSSTPSDLRSNNGSLFQDTLLELAAKSTNCAGTVSSGNGDTFSPDQELPALNDVKCQSDSQLCSTSDHHALLRTLKVPCPDPNEFPIADLQWPAEADYTKESLPIENADFFGNISDRDIYSSSPSDIILQNDNYFNGKEEVHMSPMPSIPSFPEVDLRIPSISNQHLSTSGTSLLSTDLVGICSNECSNVPSSTVQLDNTPSIIAVPKSNQFCDITTPGHYMATDTIPKNDFIQSSPYLSNGQNLLDANITTYVPKVEHTIPRTDFRLHYNQNTYENHVQTNISYTSNLLPSISATNSHNSAPNYKNIVVSNATDNCHRRIPFTGIIDGNPKREVLFQNNLNRANTATDIKTVTLPQHIDKNGMIISAALAPKVRSSSYIEPNIPNSNILPETLPNCKYNLKTTGFTNSPTTTAQSDIDEASFHSTISVVSQSHPEVRARNETKNIIVTNSTGQNNDSILAVVDGKLQYVPAEYKQLNLKDISSSSLTICGKTSKEKRGISAGDMCSLNASPGICRTPRHYELDYLRIGSFVFTPVDNVKFFKMKLIFSRRLLTYEWQLPQLNALTDQYIHFVCVEINMDSVCAMDIKQSSVRMEIKTPPIMLLGKRLIDRDGHYTLHRTPVYDRSRLVDVTHGQLYTSPFHEVRLSAPKEEDFFNRLCVFDKRFLQLKKFPVIETSNKVLEQKSIRPVVFQLSVQLLNSNAKSNFRKIIGKCAENKGLRKCTCVTGCLFSRCGCITLNSTCRPSCNCVIQRNCRNPLNFLLTFAISPQIIESDKCMMQNVFKIRDLEHYIRYLTRFPCCSVEAPIINCIPGMVECPAMCGKSYKYSWCRGVLCCEKDKPRNHCIHCKNCMNYNMIHCEKCNSCYDATHDRSYCSCSTVFGLKSCVSILTKSTMESNIFTAPPFTSALVSSNQSHNDAVESLPKPEITSSSLLTTHSKSLCPELTSQCTSDFFEQLNSNQSPCFSPDLQNKEEMSCGTGVDVLSNLLNINEETTSVNSQPESHIPQIDSPELVSLDSHLEVPSTFHIPPNLGDVKECEVVIGTNPAKSAKYVVNEAASKVSQQQKSQSGNEKLTTTSENLLPKPEISSRLSQKRHFSIELGSPTAKKMMLSCNEMMKDVASKTPTKTDHE